MITELGERLALIIDAKTDGAVSNVRRLSLEEKAAADRADVLKAKLADLETRAARQAARPSGVSASTSSQLSRTRSELAGLESTLAQVPAGAGLAERGLAKLGLQGTVTGSALAKGLGGAAIAAGVFGGFELVKAGVTEYTHLADEIRAVQYAAQGSTEDASKLVAITTALGVSSDTAALGVFRLGKNIALTPEKLSAYGVAVARDKQGNVDLIGTLENVAAAYQKTTDPAKKAAIVYEAFGRAGTSMLPILNANADKLKEIASEAAKQGRIFSAQDLANAKEYEITMREMRDSVQAVGLSLGRTLVPALSEVAGVLTDVSDAVHSNSLFGKLIRGGFEASFAPLTASAKVLGLLHHGGHSKAEQEQAAADTAAQLADSQAAAATLASTASLASGQGLADAKQSLRDARQSLADAVTARNKAAKDLAAARTGAPGADATAMQAAVARVAAAEAKLRAAEYIGGDARTSSAQSTLLSAQDHLNKLRGEGGVQTNKLATATERLHKANEAVAAARQKEQAAQRARNQATGLSAADVEKRLTAQLADKTAHVGAIGKLANLGATPELTAYLDALDKQTPGTLVKLAKGANAGLVAKLNDIEGNAQGQQQLYDTILGKPDAWRTAGADRATSFVAGWQNVLTGALPLYGPTAGRPAAQRGGTPPTLGGLLSPQVNVNGPVTVQAQDPEQFGRKLTAKQRLHALSGASL